MGIWKWREIILVILLGAPSMVCAQARLLSSRAKPASRPVAPQPKWLTSPQKRALMESSLSAPKPSGILFYCDPQCDPFAMIWIEGRSLKDEESTRRLRGKKVPRPRPMAGDSRLTLVPATEISIDTWRALTGTPHPEPGNGMMLADSDEPIKKDFNDVEVEKEIKPRALSLQFGGGRSSRSTNGSGFYQEGLANSSYKFIQGEVCTLWQKVSRYGYCLGGSKSLGEGQGRSETEARLGFRWARRSRALKGRGIEFRPSIEYLSYSPPEDLPLNATATTLGLSLKFNSVLAEQSPWWEPRVMGVFSYSLKGTDADQLRGESLRAIVLGTGISWKIATPLVFTIHSASHGLSVVPEINWTRRWDGPRGSARNPFFPSEDSLKIDNLRLNLLIQIEELSW